MSSARVIVGDCREVLRSLPSESVHCVVTSPPYWGLRDYGVDGQIGREASPEAFVAEMVAVFAEVRRVLRNDGTLWLNLGDSYAGGPSGSLTGSTLEGSQDRQRETRKNKRTIPGGLKNKDLIGIPWRVAFALQADGWYLRSDIIWSKPNPMPESVEDRPTKAHEYVFLMAKSERYFYDADSVRSPLSEKTFTTFGSTRKSKGADALGNIAAHNLSRDIPDRKPRLNDNGEPAGANLRDVWTIATRPYAGAHFATFPPDLVVPCILAGCPAGAVVLDPFCGSGTTGAVATGNGRDFVGIEINPEYAQLSRERIGMFCTLEAA